MGVSLKSGSSFESFCPASELNPLKTESTMIIAAAATATVITEMAEMTLTAPCDLRDNR